MPYKEGKAWRGKVTLNGQRYTSVFQTRKAALEWETKKKEELKIIEKNWQNGPDLLTFCSEYLIYSERYVEKTRQEKKGLIKRVLGEWGKDLSVSFVTPIMVQSYLDKQAIERSKNASNKDRKNLLSMFGYGVRFGHIVKNPVVQTDKLPHDRAVQYTPPTEDVLKLLSAATRKERVFLYAYIFTGARRSEIFRWTWNDDINFEKQSYRLGTRKTKDGSMSYEWFPMPPDLHSELEWWYKNRTIKNSPYVFTDDQEGKHYGEPYNARRRFMKGLCKRAGIKAFGFHALRRFFASRLADDGKSTNTIRRMLRHKNVNTTERYIQNINDDLGGIANGILEVVQIHPDKKSNTEKE
jgi:integrase